MEETTLDSVSKKIIYKLILDDIEWARMAQIEGMHDK